MELVLPPPITRHRINAEQFHTMAEVGMFVPGERVELIEGEIIDMAPIGSFHCGNVGWLTQTFAEIIRGEAIVWVQNALRLSPTVEVYPDLALLKPRADFYRTAHPGPDDVLLVVEVADSSSAYDRGIKADLYARYAIPEYWIVDIPARMIRFHRSPVAGRYTDITATETPGPTSVPGLAGISVDLTGTFG
ncbi:MAG: Uma2 family endonuclease [Pseudomonadota bacterium]|nr:Uma2 family endonuclease [Pseudomonadota bacterium]